LAYPTGAADKNGIYSRNMGAFRGAFPKSIASEATVSLGRVEESEKNSVPKSPKKRYFR
jgi:hypothetical protein